MAAKNKQIDYPVEKLPSEIETLKQLLSKHSSPILIKWIKDRIEYKEGLLRKNL
jgi:hypothetical protein